MNPDESISLLIEKCKQNNQEAQFEIYKKFYKNMFNTAFRILNNKEEAEDIMQECFLKAFTKLHMLDNNNAFAYSNAGVASALISLPLRYMHTTVEMVHKDDVENTIRLIYETILKIENNDTFSYFK